MKLHFLARCNIFFSVYFYHILCLYIHQKHILPIVRLKHALFQYIYLFLHASQQISQHQEHFIHMLNEPVLESRQGLSGSDDGANTGGVVEAGNGHTNYIQVTPQEKEAIERVSHSLKCCLAVATGH